MKARCSACRSLSQHLASDAPLAEALLEAAGAALGATCAAERRQLLGLVAAALQRLGGGGRPTQLVPLLRAARDGGKLEECLDPVTQRGLGREMGILELFSLVAALFSKV